MTATPLLERVTHQADDEIAHRLDGAQAAVEVLRATAEAERAARRAAGLRDANAELARARLAACAAETRRTAGMVLEARARFLDRVFHAAEQAASTLPSRGDVDACVEHLVGAALPYVDAAHCRIRCHPDARRVVERLCAARDLSCVSIVDDSSLPSGAIVESDDGRVRVDATIVGQLHRRRGALSISALAARAKAP